MPKQVICQADRGGKIIEILLIERAARSRAGELERRIGKKCRHGIVVLEPGQQHQAVTLIEWAVVVPADAQGQRQPRRSFPVVLDIPSEVIPDEVAAVRSAWDEAGLPAGDVE